MIDYYQSKTLVEALEDDGIRPPSILPELVLPWAVVLYGAAHPSLWRQMSAVLRRWRSEWGRRYVDVLFNAIAYGALFGLVACAITFVILVLRGV